MGKAKENKLYRTFVKGLITEAGFLTYPEDASTDELNTILSRKGNRSRRLGVEYQDDHQLHDLGVSESVAINEYVWGSVNNDPNVTFVCLQVGSTLHFFTMNDEPLSTQKKAFTVNLSQYKIPTASASEFANETAALSAGSGYLFVAHPHMNPLSIEYRPTTDVLVTIPIVIQIRDFEGVYDGLANDEEPSSLSAQHHYNLLNQGWVATGTKTVNISTPSYPTSPSDPSTPVVGGGGDGVYYNPYTGRTDVYSQTPTDGVYVDREDR